MKKSATLALPLSLLLLAGCDQASTSPDAPTNDASPSEDAAPSADAAALEDAAPSADAIPAPGDCYPGAADGTFHSFSAATFADPTVTRSMCDYRGDVVMVVNVAALCGYTPQYEALQGLQDRYGASGFHVLGFLADDFRMQAGSKEEIEECANRFGITFEQFDVVGVLPDSARGQHPLFSWITTQEGFEGPISWNFNKFLVSSEGTLINRWNQNVTPDDSEITSAIDAALGL